MNNRLEMLEPRRFQYNIPKMLLSGRSISLHAKKGENARGAFVITHPGNGKIRGFLEADSPRILLSSNEFSGHENIIRFQVSTEGVKEGESFPITVYISSDLGEEEIRIRTVIDKKEPESTSGHIFLAEEAEKDFVHAVSVYDSDAFRLQLIREGADSDLALYEALSKEENSFRRLEEFLIGTGQKDAVDITSGWVSKKITDPEGTLRETITLTASSWGYQEIELSADSRFLRLEKPHLTTMDFVGNTCRTGLIIDSNFLHAGKNYGRITIRTPYRTIELVVRASVSTDSERRRLHRVRKLMRKKAMNLYLDYRLGKIDLHNFAQRTESVLSAYKRAEGKDVYADLFFIFVLQADGKRREAERLLGLLEKTPERFTTPDRYAFLLFLTTFFTRDAGYIAEVRKEVQKLSSAYPDDWKIFWVRLYLQEDTGSGESGRYEEVCRQISLGCSSPVIYLEGAFLLRKYPYLLHNIDKATRLILHFASRYGLLTEQLYLEAASEEKRKPVYDPVMYKVLERCKARSGARDILEALTSMAIAGGKKDSSYFPLYKAAVMQEVSVTGLYEYYMEAMDECRIETMPEIIRRYFLYNATLNYHKKARIFRNMADSRMQIPGTFSSMRPQIEKFVVDQLAQGHIDNDLAVLYEEFLTESMLTRRLAQSLLRILFTYRLDCLSPDMKKIILSDSRFSEEKETAISGQAAMIRIYSDQTRILLEDGKGRRYASTSLYMTDHYLESPRLMQMCMAKVPDAGELALFYALNTMRSDPVDSGNLVFFRKAVSLRTLKEEYRFRIRMWLLDFYASGRGDDTLSLFLREIDPEEYAKADLGKVLKLLTEKGYFEEAYRLVLKYGYEHIPLNLLVRICSQMVLSKEYQEDEVLKIECAGCFFRGKYDQNILSYLLMYYEGTVSRMTELFMAGRQYGIDTVGIEQKILFLVLLEGRTGSLSSEVFSSYLAHRGNRKLCRAYAELASWQYFVLGDDLPDQVAGYLGDRYGAGKKLSDVGGLSLLKKLSENEERTEHENETAGKLLGSYEDRGLRFSFFQSFPRKMHSAQGILEKVFFEYTAPESSKVTLNYRKAGRDGDYTEEAMKNMFGGIRVKEFVLLPGESLECFTEEQREDGTRILSGLQNLTGRKPSGDEKDTRYGKLSSLSEALSRGDEEEARKILLDIRQIDAFVNQVFTLV